MEILNYLFSYATVSTIKGWTELKFMINQIVYKKWNQVTNCKIWEENNIYLWAVNMLS